MTYEREESRAPVGVSGLRSPHPTLIIQHSTSGFQQSSASNVKDHYCTLAEPAVATIRVERSEFRAFAYPIASEGDFAPLLRALEKEHFDATHHCWAYRLLVEGEARHRSSDAGEPSGTAGKPILSAIESADLYDIAVVVVRWYGGVKLGTGGLGRAYRAAAQEALASAPRLDRYRYERFEVDVPFAALSSAYRLIDAPHVVLEKESFGETNVFTFGVRLSRSDAFEASLSEKRFRFRRG